MCMSLFPPKPGMPDDSSVVRMHEKLNFNDKIAYISSRVTAASIDIHLEKARWEIRLARLLENSETNSIGRRDGLPWSQEELKILSQMKTPTVPFGRGPKHLDLMEYHMAELLKRPLRDITFANSRHRRFLQKQVQDNYEFWGMVRWQMDFLRSEFLDGQYWRTFAREVAREEIEQGTLELTPYERAQKLEAKRNIVRVKRREEQERREREERQKNWKEYQKAWEKKFGLDKPRKKKPAMEPEAGGAAKAEKAEAEEANSKEVNTEEKNFEESDYEETDCEPVKVEENSFEEPAVDANVEEVEAKEPNSKEANAEKTDSIKKNSDQAED